ncbi:MAG: tetratricopeptide repeat protein [bacterium]|nr:tetratricopeptide repeat protein [bacterium]
MNRKMRSINKWWLPVGFILGLILVSGIYGCRGCGAPEEHAPVKQESREVALTKDNYIKEYEVYCLSGDYEKAAGALKEAIKLDPKDANLHLELGNIYDDMGKDTESIKAYINALKLDPSLKDISCSEEEGMEKY